MRDVVDDIRGRGAELYAIGNGSVAAAKFFKEKEQLNFTLLTDPSAEAYRAAGFKSGISTTLGVKTLKSAFDALRGGHIQTSTQGHPMQQGGVLIFAPGDKELYKYISQVAGDHPEPREFLQALL